MSIDITRSVVDSLDGGAHGGLKRREERFHLDMDRRSALALHDLLKRVESLWLTQVTRDLGRFLEKHPGDRWEENSWRIAVPVCAS